MRVLFSNPPWWIDDNGEVRCGIRAGSRWPFTMRTNSRPDHPVHGEYLPYPFFMGYASAYAQKHTKATIVFRDSLARRESYVTYLRYIASFGPDIIVIESATPSWEHDKHVCKLIAQASPASHIVIVGTIATTRAQEITALGYSAIKGEYEKGIVEIINGRRGIVENNLLTAEEMNAAPYPLYDEPYALTYWDSCPTGQQMPHLQIWSSRGCPYRCCFCAWPAVMTGNDPTGSGKRTVRPYKPEYMEGMIRARLAQNPTLKSLYDDSDTFNLIEKHTIEMCAVYKRIGLPWSAMCRADTIELSTWNIMKDSGCYGVKIGMESGSQRVIDQIVNKKLDLAYVESTVLPHLKSIGMTVHTTWTVGLPGESYQEAQQTLSTIQRLYDKGLHHTHQLSGTATIEGTPLDTMLHQTAPLKAYPGMLKDNFLVSGDGQAKIEQLSRSLPPAYP